MTTIIDEYTEESANSVHFKEMDENVYNDDEYTKGIPYN